MTKNVIFADLDRTFLDDQYRYDRTKPIVDRLSALGGSIVFCSSKTRGEIEFYRQAVGINDPFIAENGAAIFIPKNYFDFDYTCEKIHQYNVIRLGISYAKLRQKLVQIRQKTGAVLMGFGDMTLEELAFETGLPLHLARLAQKREHDEPFRIVEGSKRQVLKAIGFEGLKCMRGGRYFHLTGNHDKGKAVNILKTLYNQKFGRVHTYAVGDGPNDFPMLKVVDKPFFIRQAAGANSRFNTWMGILQLVNSKIFL